MNHSAQNFVKTWLNRGDEKSDTQSFWLTLPHDVYGVENPAAFIRFEPRVKLKNVSFIDASIPTTRVLIEGFYQTKTPTGFQFHVRRGFFHDFRAGNCGGTDEIVPGTHLIFKESVLSLDPLNMKRKFP